jgi:hypothetical protein
VTEEGKRRKMTGWANKRNEKGICDNGRKWINCLLKKKRETRNAGMK